MERKRAEEISNQERPGQRPRYWVTFNPREVAMLKEMVAEGFPSVVDVIKQAVRERYNMRIRAREGYYLTKPPKEGEITPVIPLSEIDR